jgi:hypothetical protein
MKQELCMPSRIDKEKTKKNIARILDRVKGEADPHLLNEYRSLFKKEVSFFRRSWAAAYLLMLYDQGALEQGGKFRRQGGPYQAEQSGGREQRPRAGRSPSPEWANREEPHPSLPESESRRLFFSMGRNRRLFPREILGLINTKTSVSRDDIGAIRILDNYSFVQVRDTVADTIIGALDGQTFRGRTLAVNYAKARRDEADSGTGGDSPDDEGEIAASRGYSDEAEDQPDKEEI